MSDIANVVGDELGNPHEVESQFISTEIASALLAVPSVETVHVDRTAGITRVWAIVDDPPEEVYDDIYSRERSLIRQFDQEFLDFSVIARRGRETRSFVSLPCPGWTKLKDTPVAGQE